MKLINIYIFRENIQIMIDQKNEKEPVEVLFCGLVRQHDLFKKSVQEILLLKDQGLVNNIFVSTWKGELQKCPEIHDFLKNNNIIIIESDEPEDRGEGNIWCQMKSLDEGLKKIPKDKFILRTRTDIHINPDFLKKLFSEKQDLLKITHNLPKGNLFKYKIWIPWFELTKPFFMGDEAFFGLCEDLKLLINYDPCFDEKYYLGPDISHVRRFIHPFLEPYPILLDYIKEFSNERLFKTSLRKKSIKLYDFLKKFKILRKMSENNRFKVLHKRLKDPNFLNCLAAYYSILHSHFYINNHSFPNQVFFIAHEKPILMSNGKDIEKNFTKEMVGIPLGGQIYIYDMDFLNSLYEKNMNPSELANSLGQAVDRFNNPVNHS